MTSRFEQAMKAVEETEKQVIQVKKEAEEGWGASGERSDPISRAREACLLNAAAPAVPSAHLMLAERSPTGAPQLYKVASYFWLGGGLAARRDCGDEI